MLRRQSKTTASEVKEEVPLLEFSKSGYPRNHARTPSPSPARRISKNNGELESKSVLRRNPMRAPSPSATSRLLRNGSRNSNVRKPSITGDDKVSKVKTIRSSSSKVTEKKTIVRVLTGLRKKDDSTIVNEKPPRVSRRKERQEARENVTQNILNQLKERGSRGSSKTRPPLPTTTPNPVLSNVFNQVYIAQRLHSSLRSQSFRSTTPSSKNNTNATREEDLGDNAVESEVSLPKEKPVSKSVVSTTSSMETLRILNASQAAAEDKKRKDTEVPAVELINNGRSQRQTTDSENGAHGDNLNMLLGVKSLDITSHGTNNAVDGESKQAGDSKWNIFQCGGTPDIALEGNSKDIDEYSIGKDSNGDENNLEDEMQSSDEDEEEREDETSPRSSFNTSANDRIPPEKQISGHSAHGLSKDSEGESTRLNDSVTGDEFGTTEHSKTSESKYIASFDEPMDISSRFLCCGT